MEKVLESTYSKKTFYDCKGRRQQYTPRDDGGCFNLWHVELRHDPKLVYEDSYLPISMPDFSSRCASFCYTDEDQRIILDSMMKKEEKPVAGLQNELTAVLKSMKDSQNREKINEIKSLMKKKEHKRALDMLLYYMVNNNFIGFWDLRDNETSLSDK